ncbi:MAG TPA: toprim domain-containing protein [Pseudogracilibacillus sp.]|nr:toprim domain-containing protein [Pseudogracilibacillus sp.]
MLDKKVIIVEGQTDRKQLEKVIVEDVDIICTHGTFSIEKFDEMLETYQLDDREVYIFVDADESGVELRKKLTAELPHAIHLYIGDLYKEVAKTPEHILATELLKKHIEIDVRWLTEVR